MYHLIALLIGFFVDLLLGDPHSIPHPVVWIGKLISAAEKLVRRLFPKTVRGENIAGGVLWVIVVLVSTAEETEFRPESLSSRIAQLGIIDSLFTIVMFNSGERSVEPLRRIRKVISPTREGIN